MRLAYFVSAHGFGHATRTCAVLGALRDRVPTLRVELFTAAPRWIFAPVDESVRVHLANVDIGLVQSDAFRSDSEATWERLNGFIPFDESLLDELAEVVARGRCDAVVCDIAPLGLAVAERTGVPGVLVENFTWDWIYDGFDDKRLSDAGKYFREWYSTCALHVQTEPVCAPSGWAFRVPPVSRKPTQTRQDIRDRLGVADDEVLVLISLGGTPHRYPFLDRLRDASPQTRFVITGAEVQGAGGGAILLPFDTDLDHPSLIRSADVVVGKAGYSTLAEVYAAGVPFACFRRSGFPESPVLENFVKTHMPGILLDGGDFDGGDWLGRLEELFALAGAARPQETSGADAVADHLIEKLGIESNADVQRTLAS